MAERWHSVEEVSLHLGLAQDTIYRWIESGRLPGHRIGRLWKFKLAEVDDWVREGRTVEARPAVDRSLEHGERPAHRRRAVR